jgi:hypothetical protein
MKETTMKRRDFLRQSIEASLLAYLPGGLLMAAKSGAGTEEQSGQSAALNPVSKYVESYVPPRGGLDPARRQTITFDVVGWGTDNGRQNVSTPVVGEITVSREPLVDAIVYDVTQRLGKQETMTGRFRCRSDQWHSLADWECEYSLSADLVSIARLTQTQQSGRQEEENVVIRTNGAESVFACPVPLLCRWGMLDVAGRMREFCEADSRFTLLHEPSGVRPSQRFREDHQVVLPRGDTAPIRTFLQTGDGVVPTHWIVDSQGRPLFVTAFLMSWAMKTIS